MARWRALELFCGLGGFAAAASELAEVVAAVDVSQVALRAYSQNFDHPCWCRLVETLSAREIAALGANLWWMSPPCQPYTRRGQGRDLDDPRGRGFLAVLDLLAELRPTAIGLENVPEFAQSEAHSRLREILDQAGYEVDEQVLCPSELGWPNRRRRFYLLASREGLRPRQSGDLRSDELSPPSLVDLLNPEADPDSDPDLRVDSRIVERYQGALDIVDADDPAALTACFTSAYGRSHVRSGSYLRSADGLRRFSPAEILRLLGFPADYRLPPELPLKNAWRLVGNSLSLPPLRRVLDRLPLQSPLDSNSWRTA